MSTINSPPALNNSAGMQSALGALFRLSFFKANLISDFRKGGSLSILQDCVVLVVLEAPNTNPHNVFSVFLLPYLLQSIGDLAYPSCYTIVVDNV